MKLDQLYYTSCRRGLSPGSGFQTRSMSVGLSTEDRREIEIKGGYRLPRDVDLAALGSLADERLPVAYRVYRLLNGRFVLTRSACAGQDYTGRGGNFFAHTLVFEGEPPAGVWPASFLNWTGWLPRLAPEEDGTEPSPPLPVLALSDQSTVGGPSFRELSLFLRERDEAGQHFLAMLAALFLSRRDGRLLLVRDTPRNNILWLACLQMALPSAAAWRLSWSSYQDDPRGAGQINATCGETSYRLDRNARDFQYYLFDFTGNQFSSVIAGDEYAIRAAGWLLTEPDTLAAFHAFAALFVADKLLDRLNELAMLFRMVRGETEWRAEHWRQAAELVRECLATGAGERLVKQFLLQAGNVSAEAIVPWFALYVELAANSNAPLAVLESAFLRRLLQKGDAAELGRLMVRLAGGNEGNLLAIAKRVQEAHYECGEAEKAGLALRRFGAEFLAPLPLSQEGLALRSKLEALGSYDILLGEWDACLSASNRPATTWREYCSVVLSRLPQYARECGALMAESAWQASRAGNLGEAAREWCEMDDLVQLPSALQREILLAAYQSLPFDFAGEPEQIEKHILALAMRWKVALPDDRSKLRALRRIPQTGVTRQEAADYVLVLRLLSNRHYSSLLDDYFSALFSARPRPEPDALLAALAAVRDLDREAQWCNAFGKRLEYQSKKHSDESFGRWFLKCWLTNLAGSLDPETRRALLPYVAGLYCDDTGYKLLAERETGKYRDELLTECDMARLRLVPSFGERVQRVVSSGLKIIGWGGRAQDTSPGHRQPVSDDTLNDDAVVRGKGRKY